MWRVAALPDAGAWASLQRNGRQLGPSSADVGVRDRVVDDDAEIVAALPGRREAHVVTQDADTYRKLIFAAYPFADQPPFEAAFSAMQCCCRRVLAGTFQNVPDTPADQTPLRLARQAFRAVIPALRAELRHKQRYQEPLLEKDRAFCYLPTAGVKRVS